MNKNLFKWILLLLVNALLLFFIFQRFVFHDFQMGYFIDENIDIRVAVNFFRYGIYGKTATMGTGFEDSSSSGLWSTWSAGLGWVIGGNLFVARLFFALQNLILFIILALNVIDSISPQLKEFRVSIALMVYLLCFLSISYFHAATIFVLGEVPGALMLGFGYYYLFIKKEFKISVLFFSFSVWFCKFIYLPFVLMAVIYFVLSNPRRKRIGLITNAFLFFLVPVFLWWAIIIRNTGWSSFKHYLYFQSSMSMDLFKGFGGLSKKVVLMDNPPSLINRFTDPRLEWSFYDFATRIKIIFFCLITPLVFGWQLQKERFAINALNIFKVGMSGLFLAFSIWYFFFHFQMWVRHILPAMLVAFGLCIVVLLKKIDSLQVSKQVGILAAILFVVLVKEGRKTPELLGALHDSHYFIRHSLLCKVSNPLTASDEEVRTTCEAANPYFVQSSLKNVRKK